MSALVADQVWYRGRITAVTQHFAPGQVTAVIGPNGAGKSTLLSVLAGLIPPETGTVRLGDASIADLSPRERARRIGYLPQSGEAAWNMPARAIVALGRLPHGDNDAAAIDAAMAATDTASFANVPINEMSGGERARVLLARVIAGTPQWILADEPLANLDPPHARDMLALLHQRAGAGCGVIAVLHDLNAATMADQVVVMRGGAIIAAGPPRTVLTPQWLEAAFAMRFVVQDIEQRRVILPA